MKGVGGGGRRLQKCGQIPALQNSKGNEIGERGEKVVMRVRGWQSDVEDGSVS